MLIKREPQHWKLPKVDAGIRRQKETTFYDFDEIYARGVVPRDLV